MQLGLLETVDREKHTKLVAFMVNLATTLENQDKNLDTWLFWNGGHCADEDPEVFINWIGKITGYTN